jgi:hypothetical protein
LRIGLPGSKGFLRISFALGGIHFLQLHGLSEKHSLAAKHKKGRKIQSGWENLGPNFWTNLSKKWAEY